VPYARTKSTWVHTRTQAHTHERTWYNLTRGTPKSAAAAPARIGLVTRSRMTSLLRQVLKNCRKPTPSVP
jgi:hypothetical protein